MTAGGSHPRTSFWRSPLGVATIAALVLGGAVLLWSDRPNVIGWLPWLVVLACPLLHVFMHRGHQGHGGRQDDEATRDDPSETSAPTHRH